MTFPAFGDRQQVASLLWWHRQEDLALDIVFVPPDGWLGDLTFCASPSLVEKLHPLTLSEVLNSEVKEPAARAEAHLSLTSYGGSLSSYIL